LVHVSEKSWDSLQDVYGLVNEPGWSVRCEPISMTSFIRHRVREVLERRRARSVVARRSSSGVTAASFTRGHHMATSE
jgi:hypothetical protein